MRRAFNLRSLVEGTFGILKNPSRQRHLAAATSATVTPLHAGLDQEAA